MHILIRDVGGKSATGAGRAVNHGSNSCWGAKFPSRVPTHRFPFLFYNFPGSNGAEFQTVRTGSSATPRPSKLPFRQPPGATGAVPRRVAARITRSPD